MMKPVEITCEKCSSTFKWYTAAQSGHLYCGTCGQYHVANKKGQVSRKSDGNSSVKRPKYTFAIGHQFTFDNLTYTLIGSTWKEDSQYTEFKWKEYTLFNDEAGYLFLSEGMGHWMLLTELDRVPTVKFSRSTAILDDTKYAVFQKSKSNTIHALGEFSEMPLRRGIRYEEYIAPPEMLSLEITAGGHTWFHGKHISEKELAKAANIETSELPARNGIGPVQPFSSNVSQQTMILAAVVAVLLLLVIMAISSASRVNSTVVTASSGQRDTLTGKITTPSFNLTTSGAVRLYYQSDCYNNWSEAQVELVNEATGESQGTIIGAEYYAGVEGGESWSEGSNSSDQIISSVPAGKYHLLITPFRGTSNTSGQIYSLSLEQGVTPGSNFILSLIHI